jgi:hypothetical protein
MAWKLFLTEYYRGYQIKYEQDKGVMPYRACVTNLSLISAGPSLESVKKAIRAAIDKDIKAIKRVERALRKGS